MDYDKLKSEIKEIGKVSASVPEAFREKCFEVLLNHLLSGPKNISPPADVTPPLSDPKPRNDGNLNLPSTVRALMRKKEITQEQIETIVMVEGDEFHFIKEPTHGQAAKGQIDWALLMALKNGILTNNLRADPEEVRSIVQEKGFYDRTNFSSNFKKQKYAKLFRGTLERQGDPQPLTTDGETELANLIKGLSGLS